MTQRIAIKVASAGILAGVVSLSAGVYSMALPYRLTPTQDQLLEISFFVEYACLALAIGLGVVSIWGDARSRRLGYAAFLLGITALILSVLTTRPHSVSRMLP